ncbi:MAG TPA: LysE family transporter [Patescibacteria group bacterium]|nr:LysE family transporter [Patescibacteria group bacterium]
MEIVSLLISALVLGLIGGAIPGPIITAVFTEIIQSGLWRSFRIIFIGLITEAIIALFCVISIASLNLPESIFRIIALIGAGILIWLATLIWKITKIDTKTRVHFSTKKIVAMILANGALWIFWITVAIPKAIILSNYIAYGEYLYLVILELGWLISTAGIAFIFSRFRSWLSQPHIVPYIFKICALAFVYFALDAIYQTAQFFLL